jgi:hypothetical protein
MDLTEGSYFVVLIKAFFDLYGMMRMVFNIGKFSFSLMFYLIMMFYNIVVYEYDKSFSTSN